MMDGPTGWEENVLASMTRDQLVVFAKLHEAHGELRRENARLRRLAFGAGMALAGVIVAPEWGADLGTAQDLIAQMLEES
jgi:hypothetical protein